MSHSTGHRRFRLSSKKNAERKKYSLKPSTLPVSIPLSDAVSVFKVSLPIDLLSFNVSIPLEAFLDSPANSLGTLKSRLVAAKAVPPGWLDVSPDTSDYTTFCKLQSGLHNACTVQCSLRIFADFTWTFFYCGRQVKSSQTALLADIPVFLNTVSRVTEVMEIVDTAKLCCGNPDDKYAILHTVRKGRFMDSSGTQVVASLESDTLGFSTIRHSECELILEEKASIRCEKCKTHRKLLNSMLNRHQKGSPSDRVQPSSHANFSVLSTPEKIGRLHNLHQANRQLKQQLERVNRRITQVIEQDGIVLDEATHSDFKTIMKESAEKAANSFPDGSFQQLFWEQQQQASSVKDSRSMRWHPLIIKWCIYLRHLSSGAYEALRSSGCVKLPSQRTLRDYTHYVRALPGFSDDVDKQLIEAAKLQTCEEFQNYVVLVMDEMHIKEDLVYDKHSGELVGFVNLGETNNHLLQFEQQMEGSTSEHEPLANSMVVIMVRGLFRHLQFPYAQFPCASVTGDLLFDPFWEAVSRLERCGLKVLALTCDGASVNRRLFKLHQTGKQLVYKVINPFATERYLYFFSDPPHLLKTVRNAWQSRKRQLWCNGKEIKWEHLAALYKRDSGAVKEAPGLSLVPKLKWEHIHLTSFSKMRVDLAAQVLSESVATAMKLTGGDEVTETVKFVEMFDKFFDCLNVNNFTTGHHKRKVFKLPYKSANDFRLKWLKETFLAYLSDWEQSVEERPGFSKLMKKMMLLSPETRLGLKITVNSFVELVEFLFTIPGIKAFLSEKLSQDPLEKFFGCQRQRGRVNENPNTTQFYKNTQALRVINSFCMPSVRGNCRGNKAPVNFEAENQPLSKRRRTK